MHFPQFLKNNHDEKVLKTLEIEGKILESQTLQVKSHETLTSSATVCQCSPLFLLWPVLLVAPI